MAIKIEITKGAERIVLERSRQILSEGWTPEHDAQHGEQELIRAAICYIVVSADPIHGDAPPTRNELLEEEGWPFEESWFKPTDHISNLTKAGALIAAEIDRLTLKEENERRQTDERVTEIA